MIAISSTLKKALFSSQDVEVKFKIEIEDLRDGTTYDVTPLVSNPGRISRRLEYDTGKFSPGNHSFDMTNTKDIGAYILSQYAYLGEEFWMDKVYNVYIGVVGEMLHIYTGQIYSKKENRLDGKVSVGSKDITKLISDFQICEPISASSVFTPSTSGDSELRMFQQVLKFGTHLLITNSNDAGPLKSKDGPFSCTRGLPSLYNGKITGYSTVYTAKCLWYFPFQNQVLIGKGGLGNESYYYQNGSLKLYYWDYQLKLWKTFSSTSFSANSDVSNKIHIFRKNGINGLFVNIGSAVPLLEGGTWSDYVTGTGAWVVSTGDSIDPAICVESVGVVTDERGLLPNGWNTSNPVTLIYELLWSTRFAWLDSSIMDHLSFHTTIDYAYSFDAAYDYMNSEDVKINTDITSQVSILAVIENICKICGLVFQVAAKRSAVDTAVGWGSFAWGADPWGSRTTSQDRRIRLLVLEPFSSILDEPDYLLKFSTCDKLQEFIMDTTSDTIKDKVIVSNFDSSISTEKVRDGYAAGSGNRSINLVDDKVYLYDSFAFAEAMAQRRLSQLISPIISITTELDRVGLIVECGDMVKLHEHLNDDEHIVQVNDETKELLTGKTTLTGKKYTQLWGPDENTPCKLWAFADYAYTSNDECPAGGYDGHSYYAF